MKENGIDSYEKAFACKELWNIENGRVLCIGCHRLTPNYKRLMNEQNALDAIKM